MNFESFICWYRAAECLSVRTKPRGGWIGF